MNPSEGLRILLVEDDPKLAEVLTSGLRENGHAVAHASTAAAARRLGAAAPPELVLLDLGLPDGDGLDLIPALRALEPPPFILITTARDAVPDRVRGLDAGADDYLTKPYPFPELLARLRAFQRRRARAAEPAEIRLDCLRMDLIRREARCGETELVLTPREFDLLACLARRHGEIVTRSTLADEVWKSARRYTPLDNLIDVNVSRLRVKLQENGCRLALHTLRGVGFRLDRAESP